MTASARPKPRRVAAPGACLKLESAQPTGAFKVRSRLAALRAGRAKPSGSCVALMSGRNIAPATLAPVLAGA